MDVLWGSAAFFGGVLICLLNYCISKWAMERHRDQYAAFTVARQMLNVGFLVGCYLIGENTELSTVALLIGAALGITVPSIYFTAKLLKQNQSREENTSGGKEEETDG